MIGILCPEESLNLQKNLNVNKASFSLLTNFSICIKNMFLKIAITLFINHQYYQNNALGKDPIKVFYIKTCIHVQGSWGGG